MPIGNGGIIGPANVPTITTASGVWSLREQQQAQGRGAWPLAIAPDPYFEYTTLLLPGNGTDGANNNTFLDSGTANSGSGFTITRNGNTTQGTFSPFSQTGWGNYFDGSSDSITAPNSCATLGAPSGNTNNFTVEAFLYPTGTGIYQPIGTTYSGSNYWAFNLNRNMSTGANAIGRVAFAMTDSFVLETADSKLIANQWNHIAAVRTETTVSLYVNGVREATNTSSVDPNPTGVLQIGRDSILGRDYPGYASNLRIVRGSTQPYSATSSNITVPTASLTAVSGTSLLTCQSNRFIDNSTNNFTITRNGDTRVVAFSPFNPTLPWSSATNGGSGYFDGSGDYLSVADNAALDLGNSDFTIEGWFYMPSAPSSSQIVGLVSKWGASGQRSWSVYFYNAGGTYQIYLTYTTDGSTNQNLYNQGFVFPAGQWAHIAVVRSTTTVKFYINGSVAGTGSENISTNTVFDSTSSVAIASDTSTGANYLTGYTSSIRIVKGTAVYTGAFTPPSLLPLTNAGSTSAASYPSTTNVNTSFASSATSLLLNFTNAGIYDATSKNDLETLDNTVNGVRISTAQSQFGGSSIYFDGTGTDYLWIQADQPIQRFGTAPFTIELWIRLAATGSARGLVAKGTSTTGWLVSLNTSNQVVFTYGTSTITSTGTISAGAWTYIAVVREGTGSNQTKIYIGGVNDGTGTVSTDFTQTSSMYIGADRTGGSLFSGYMQDVRITNGYARTVTTIPTTAFPTL